MSLGQRLRKLRKEKKLTQAQLAHQFNLAESTISLYENSKRSPDYSTLQEMSLFFNVSADYLIGNAPPANHPYNADIPVLSHIHPAAAPTGALFWYYVGHDGLQTAGILSGDLLLIEPCDEIRFDNSIYLVQLENTDVEACRITSQDQLLVFHMLNPAKKAKILPKSNQEEIRIVGKVLELRRGYA